jgi:hypothetical protein
MDRSQRARDITSFSAPGSQSDLFHFRSVVLAVVPQPSFKIWYEISQMIFLIVSWMDSSTHSRPEGPFHLRQCRFPQRVLRLILTAPTARATS